MIARFPRDLDAVTSAPERSCMRASGAPAKPILPARTGEENGTRAAIPHHDCPGRAFGAELQPCVKWKLRHAPEIPRARPRRGQGSWNEGSVRLPPLAAPKEDPAAHPRAFHDILADGHVRGRIDGANHGLGSSICRAAGHDKVSGLWKINHAGCPIAVRFLLLVLPVADHLPTPACGEGLDGTQIT